MSEQQDSVLWVLLKLHTENKRQEREGTFQRDIKVEFFLFTRAILNMPNESREKHWLNPNSLLSPTT